MTAGEAYALVERMVLLDHARAVAVNNTHGLPPEARAFNAELRLVAHRNSIRTA